MIPVTKQLEPDTFDRKVRQKGISFLRRKGISRNSPLPSNIQLHDYWRCCLDDLYSSYNGICAYLAVHFERSGGASIDHFIAKSQQPGLAYEWDNYRLACSTMNIYKSNHSNILDPCKIKAGWFHLEFVTGCIYPNKKLPPNHKSKVEATINLLNLDNSSNRKMRARRYQEYLEGSVTEKHLKKDSPFVWSEAKRQGLLKDNG